MARIVDRETLLQAARNAEAAGDTAAVQRIAAILNRGGPTSGPSEAYSSLRPDYGLFEGAGKGLSRGFSRFGSTVTDILPALGGAALGFDDYAREQLAEAAAKEEELQRTNPAQYQSFRDVEGITDVPGFIMETLGEQAANILPSLAGGLGLGALGARTAATAATKGIVEKELKKAALKQAAAQIAQGQGRGQLAGAFAGSYALNAPEVFQNIYEETGELAPGAAAAFSTASAALDSILPAQLAKSLTGPMKVGVTEALLARTGMDRGFLRKLAAGTLAGTATEGPTEAVQEAISIAAERFVAENPEAFTEREIERLKESFVRGAVAGGGLSAAGAVPEGIRESAAVSQERAAAPVVEDALGPPPEGAAPTPPTPAAVEPESVIPEPTVRAQPATPAPVSPRAQEILRRMGYTEEGLSQAQAEALIEENGPEMLDYLDESVALPEETVRAAPTQPAPKTAGPTPQEELDALKAEVARSEAEGAAREAATPETVRLYRVEATPEQLAEAKISPWVKESPEFKRAMESSGRWFTDDPAEADWYLKNEYPKGRVVAVDVPVAEAEKFRVSNIPEKEGGKNIEENPRAFSRRPEKEFFLPREMAGQAKPTTLPTAAPTVAPAVVEELTQEELTQEPAPQVEPDTLIPADIVALRAWGKANLGMGPTANLFKEGHPDFIGGKDLADPEQAAQVRETINKYRKGRSEGIQVKTAEFLSRPELAVDTGPVGPAPRTELPQGRKLRKLPTAFTQTANELSGSQPPIQPRKDYTPEQAAATETVVDDLVTDTTTQRVEGTTKDVQVPVPKPISTATYETFWPEGRSETEGIDAFVSELGRNPADPVLQGIRKEAARKLSPKGKKELAQLIRESGASSGLALENASNSPKLEGDLLAAVQAGNLKKTISLLLGKTAKRPEVQQILKRVQSMGLKTKIVVGAVPDAGLPMFAGPTALSADIASLAEVQQLLASGADPEQVRQDTGWFKGTDGKWRFEISDSDARMITPVTELTASWLFGKATKYKLSEVLDHPALYAAYPDAADIDFVVRKGFMDFGGLQGSFDGVNQIRVTPYAKDPESTILHEVQHWVQTREGFAQGGNESSAIDAVMSTGGAEKIAATMLAGLNKKLDVLAETERLVAAVPPGLLEAYHQANNEYENHPSRDLPLKERMADPDYLVKREEENRLDNELRAAVGEKSLVISALLPPEGPEWEAFSELRRRDYAERAKKRMAEFVEVQQRMAAVQSGDIDALRKVIKDSGQAYNLYRRLAGEIEARNTQARQKMTPAERIYNPPEVTADVKADEAIVVMFGEDTAAIPAASIQPTSTMFAPQKAGSYDPVTDTITLDPELGLNEHTLIHELGHAALAERIADPKSKEAKAFGEFFQIVKNQLGGTYGGKDVQEFAAELMGNEQFAASTKAMKAPKGGTLWDRIVQTLAEFFGFRKSQSVYDAGIKYINELLNVPASAEPTLTQKLFMGTPNQASQAAAEILTAAKAAPKATLRDAQELVDRATKEGGAAHTAFGFLNLQNLHDMFAAGDAADKVFAKIPKAVQRLVLQRLGFINNESARISEERAKFPMYETNPALMERAHDIAFKAREGGVDLAPGGEKKLNTAEQRALHKELSQQLNALPEAYREMYNTMRKDYDSVYDAFQEAIVSLFASDPKKAAEMKARFSTEMRIAGYIPSTRFGDLQVYFTDPATGKEAMESFEYISDKEAFIKAAGLKPGEYYEKRKDENLSRMGNRVPPSAFVKELTDTLQAGGATDEMLGNVRELYLTMFPASSLAKNFIKSRNVPGMSKDMPRVHADFMLRATKQLADLKYAPDINDLMTQAEGVAQDASNSPVLRAAARNLYEQRGFLNNPTYSGLVNGLSTASYAMNLTGNISAAVVNGSSLPLLTFPILAARYNAGAVIKELGAAMKIAAGSWGEGKYKALYEFINAHGQLTHTMHRELVESSRTKTGDSKTLLAKVLHLASIPFVFVEQYARATTAIAAYELALNTPDIRGKKMNEKQALEYALDTVIRSNTAGTAAASPRYMQTEWGRVILTFKSFNLNGSFVAARGLWEAVKNEDAIVKQAAIRQSVAMFSAAGAFGGIMGLPFMGMAASFADIMAGLINMVDEDDEDYFSAQMFIRENAGRFLAYGPVDFLTGAAIGRRTVLTQDLVMRDDPKTVEDQGIVAAMFKQMLGPMGGYAIDLPNALGNIKDGHYARGAEQLLPSAMRNVVKGFRYMSDGAVLTKNGDVITSDVTGFTVAKQILGFSPSALADLYDRRNEAMQFTTQVADRKQRLLDVIFAARNSGDSDTRREAERKLQELGRKHPGLVNKDTVNRSMRARDAAIRDSVTGLRFPTWAQPEVRRRFMLDED